MRKPKLILKIDRDNRAKLYFNGKWHQNDVVKLDLHGEPWEYVIETEEFVRNKYGVATIIDNEIVTEKKVYRIGQPHRENQMGSKERITEIEKAIAETKRAAEEMEKLNAMMKEHLRIMEEGRYAKTEHDGKERKDR